MVETIRCIVVLEKIWCLLAHFFFAFLRLVAAPLLAAAEREAAVLVVEERRAAGLRGARARGAA